MNVKKYRATTTREALEQVKQELGEDAFVLETKQVRSGGFLGLRSRKEIEISAASADFAKSPEEFFKSGAKESSSLELVDDSFAAPRQTPVVDPDCTREDSQCTRRQSGIFKERRTHAVRETMTTKPILAGIKKSSDRGCRTQLACTADRSSAKTRTARRRQRRIK